jgi:hypothetical protein
MPGPLVGATSSIPPSPNLALQSIAASPGIGQIEPHALQLSDRTRLHLEKAAFWGAADGGPDALQSVADIKLASASPAITSWENAVKERIGGAENITLSSMTEILKEIFQDAREQRCKKLLLVGSEGQILLKQKESVIKTYRVQQNGTFVERHEGVNDRLTHSVLNSLYGEDISARFPARPAEGEGSHTADFDRSECTTQSETDGDADSDSIYGYKVAGMYNGYAPPENNRLEINEVCASYAGAPIAENNQPSSEPASSPASSSSGRPSPLMLMANSIQLEEHMPAANDRYAHPGQQDENSPVNDRQPMKEHPDIERYQQHAEVEMQALRIIKNQLQKCTQADENGEAKHYLRYIEAYLEKKKIIAETYNELRQCTEENLNAGQAALVELIDALMPFDEVKRVVNKYFSEHRLITLPRTERPGSTSSANPLTGNDIKRNRSPLTRRALSSPVAGTSVSIASSIEASEIIGSIEFQRMLEMFESLKKTKEPQN